MFKELKKKKIKRTTGKFEKDVSQTDHVNKNFKRSVLK